jgi:hypothetical protein
VTQPITNTEKLAELKRERAQRAHVYPRLIEAGKLTRENADRQAAILNAIIDDYEARAEVDRRMGDLFGQEPKL